MTALAEYTKLEAEARFFASGTAQPVDAIVSFGERSLIIMQLDDQPLAHWPLATLQASGQPDDAVVKILPDPSADERIELYDPAMIVAIRAVCPGLYRPAPRNRRMGRIIGWFVVVVGVVALGLFATLPGMAQRLAPLMPASQSVRLGDAVAARVGEWLADGSPGAATVLCAAPGGQRALDSMIARLQAPALSYPLHVSVVDHGAPRLFVLPGGRVLLSRGILDAAKTPEEVAGLFAHAIGHATLRTPMRRVFAATGTPRTIMVLAGARMDPEWIASATETILGGRPPQSATAQADQIAFRLLAQAGLPVVPFVAFLDRLAGKDAPYPASRDKAEAARRMARATRADKVGTDPFRPALQDREWLELANICDVTRSM